MAFFDLPTSYRCVFGTIPDTNPDHCQQLWASAEEISKLFRLHRIEIVGNGALTLKPT